MYIKYNKLFLLQIQNTWFIWCLFSKKRKNNIVNFSEIPEWIALLKNKLDNQILTIIQEYVLAEKAMKTLTNSTKLYR